jgi:hypothetical protein
MAPQKWPLIAFAINFFRGLLSSDAIEYISYKFRHPVVQFVAKQPLATVLREPGGDTSSSVS